MINLIDRFRHFSRGIGKGVARGNQETRQRIGQGYFLHELTVLTRVFYKASIYMSEFISIIALKTYLSFYWEEFSSRGKFGRNLFFGQIELP